MDTTSDNSFPQSHRFNAEGDSITGDVKSYTEGVGKFGPVPIMNLDTDMGERAVWLFSSILREKVGKAAPKIGERVVVTYLGEAVSASSGNAYKKWNVETPDRPAEVPDFAGWAHDSTYQGDTEEGAPWGS